MSGITLTHAQAVNRLKDITDEVQRLHDKKDKSPEDDAKVPALLAEFRQVDRHRKDLEHDSALAEIRDAAGKGNIEGPDSGTRGDADPVDDVLAPPSPVRQAPPGPGGFGSPSRTRFRNPYDLSEVRTYGRSTGQVADELRSRAHDAIERMQDTPDDIRGVCAKLIDRHGATEDNRLSRHMLVTSHPTYVRAFGKLMRSQGNVAYLDADEQAAITRAMSLTDAAGGYLVPFQLDPTVILTANGSSNPVRKLARVVQATGDTWYGISSAGVTGSWDAEASEVSDDAPTLAQPTIPIYMGRIFVPISIEASMDEQNVAQEVSNMIAFEKDRMEGVAHVLGSGSGEPTGIVTALVGTSSVVASATTDTFALTDIYSLDSALPARYAQNGSWLMHRAIANLTRRFDTAGGAALWATLGEGLPQGLLGRAFNDAEAMDGTVTALAENYLAIFGDFRNYVIADRVGTTVEYIPHLFGANRRPTGQRGWFAWFRQGADSVNDAAFRMLNVT